MSDATMTHFWSACLAMFVLLLPRCEADAVDDIITGAGATFPAPLYRNWCDAYFQQTGVRVTYEPVGSGTGISRLYARSVDWGGTDAFIADDDMPFTPAPIVHLPTCMGAVAILCNIPDVKEINLTPDVLADILRGQITLWSDKRLAAVKPQRRLPDLAITVVHRSDASGTTFILSDYLTKTTNKWRNTIGRGRQLAWPVGLGLSGSDKLVAMVDKVPGAIGYAELTYAQRANVLCARIQNHRGEFLAPSVGTVTAAGRVDIPADTRVYLSNTRAEGGYPIAGFTWAICYREQKYDQRTREHAKLLAQFLWWMVHDGQRTFGTLSYAPLPEKAVKHAEVILGSLTYDGRPLLEPSP